MPSTAEYTAISAGKVSADEMRTNQSAIAAFKCVLAITAAMPA